MKLLFVAKHYGYCRHFYQVFRELVARGDEVDLVFNGIKGGKAGKGGEPTGKIEGQEIVDELALLSPNLRVHRTAIGKRKDRRAAFARHLRLFRDYFRYYHPDYVKAKKLRHRVEKLVPHWGVWLAKKLYRSLGYAPIRAWSSLYGYLESLIPADPQITRALAAFQPDLAVITPLIEADSIQVDHLKSMKKLKYKTILSVASWDNLTNKGILHVKPDWMLVWNRFQRDEASKYHGFDPNRVIATGSQSFEHWFHWKLALNRKEFLREVGLPEDARFLLYVASSPFIAPEEFPFFQRLIEAYRSSGIPELANLHVLLRPHPQNFKQWDSAVGMDKVVVYPHGGQFVTSTSAREVYFASLYHSAGVFGINTSAMVEAGIVDRPVFSVRDPDFSLTQEGTLHFRYLSEGGLLSMASDLPEHVTHLSQALNDSEYNRESRKKFVTEFLRPESGAPDSNQAYIQALDQIRTEQGDSRVARQFALDTRPQEI